MKVVAAGCADEATDLTADTQVPSTEASSVEATTSSSVLKNDVEPDVSTVFSDDALMASAKLAVEEPVVTEPVLTTVTVLPEPVVQEAATPATAEPSAESSGTTITVTAEDNTFTDGNAEAIAASSPKLKPRQHQRSPSALPPRRPSVQAAKAPLHHAKSISDDLSNRRLSAAVIPSPRMSGHQRTGSLSPLSPHSPVGARRGSFTPVASIRRPSTASAVASHSPRRLSTLSKVSASDDCPVAQPIKVDETIKTPTKQETSVTVKMEPTVAEVKSEPAVEISAPSELPVLPVEPAVSEAPLSLFVIDEDPASNTVIVGGEINSLGTPVSSSEPRSMPPSFIPRRRFSTVSCCPSVAENGTVDEEADRKYRKRMRDKINELMAYVAELETRANIDHQMMLDQTRVSKSFLKLSA